MGEQEQAQQALTAMFRRDQAEKEAHPPRKPRGPSEHTLHWILAIVIVIVILAPFAFIVIYPRFGPTDTMTAFCMAEADGEYATAYALLSKRAQQGESLDNFTQASKSTILTSCDENNGIPFIFGGTKATLDVTYNVMGVSNQTDGTMSFVRENGQWRVDSMTPDLFSI